ncbi:MAG: hypothetical protein OXU64_13220 [Gemmatimonadota bacterium]|nr:hypothetical protein [Gemmatimonadota bacterium]
MRRAAALVAVLPLLPACDSPVKTEEPLTRGQAAAILREIVHLTAWVEEGVNMIRCSLGGGARIIVTEKVQESGDTVTSFTRWIIEPDRCELRSFGDTLVLTGDPSVVFESEFWYRGFLEEGEVDMEAAGSLTWRKNDGSSGTCEVDLAVEDAPVDTRDTGEIDGALEGRLCGFDVAIHFSEF